MGKLRQTLQMRNFATTVVAVVVLSGCGQTADWITGRASTSDGEAEILGAPEMEVYIAELGQIASGDPAATAEIFADASAASQLIPSPSTNLRLGLVLAIPGHAESDPVGAQRLLREVLTQTVLLTPAEISLATIHLNSVERQIVAETEARSSRVSSTRAAQSQKEATKQRLTAVEAENHRLRRELAEAEQKLEAISSIERSIRGQE